MPKTTNRTKSQQGGTRIPRGGLAREQLREKGQFWTPGWIAKPMVAYALSAGADSLFDPAVGAGAFFRAAKDLKVILRRSVAFEGCEVDPQPLEFARRTGLRDKEMAKVELRDFVLSPPAKKYRAIVANPPYVRHHRLTATTKETLRELAKKAIGRPLDSRAGLHIFFLIRALQVLDSEGRLAFIMPADTCEGVFALPLWNWIASHFRLEAVVTFAPGATPFPGVDTNPVIFLMRLASPVATLKWCVCLKQESTELLDWVLSGFQSEAPGVLDVTERPLKEAIQTGLSRPPRDNALPGVPLSVFASVMRGIATGANDFFFLAKDQIQQKGLPTQYFLRAIGRTRDVSGNEILPSDLKRLEEIGRPTYLLSIRNRSDVDLPVQLKRYLEEGKGLGLPARPLISTRSPWFRMETRTPPPILFAYLGRRHARFLRNRAGVVPLTGFLAVYPNDRDPESIETLWMALQDQRTLTNLRFVGKSYGSGAIKVEPRNLEKLIIPNDVLSDFGLSNNYSLSVSVAERLFPQLREKGTSYRVSKQMGRTGAKRDSKRIHRR